MIDSSSILPPVAASSLIGCRIDVTGGWVNLVDCVPSNDTMEMLPGTDSPSSEQTCSTPWT